MTDLQVPDVTCALVRQLIAMRTAPPAPEAVTVAKQCLLDWLGVTLAARHEPLVEMLCDELDGADGACSVLVRDRPASLLDAVLINGAAGHALDYDDVITAMGHPTAPVAPAVIALGEVTGASGAKVVAAFIAGLEAECRVANLLGPSHYAKGWHGTATFGCFGAAAAAGHLLDLDEAQMCHAFGIAGTQAAGLKSVFGTMSKPLHAGRAAQNGVLAARLARRGFTSDTDILGSAQGFAATQSTSVDRGAALAPRALPWVVDVLFKYHAACYLTHNTIEAAAALRDGTPFSTADIEAVTVEVQPMHMGVCNIEAPRTGLECKFSLRMTCAMALLGEDTFDEALYSDTTAARPDLAALCARTQVEPCAPTIASTVHVRLSDGRKLSHTADVTQPVRDLAAQQQRIERKFRSLGNDSLAAGTPDRIIALCRDLDRAPDLSNLLAACAEAVRV
ncbi:MmgE/PrpD family protein [Polymorphobacter arshaanensis]|nr:MmgE/PrpD family protein [Polymorphobacter arshaanensis]